MKEASAESLLVPCQFGERPLSGAARTIGKANLAALASRKGSKWRHEVALVCRDRPSRVRLTILCGKLASEALSFVLELSQGAMVAFQRPSLGQIKRHRGPW
jgi:hypothetical protein